ncbi:uncharacterized protein N7473_003812 [Penicillium subrubescens]|uniref:MARVEL domain-containing protein n=1 Tax=Penicillium subrubescens TaxID=1316194 RepID=A0A1Q5UB53_9EURO|nr:uncharacterized protein N7473_003812 [Penicillium subrubescens]KAJ5906896.1 hypothetical protein N7473_003812 [Penicillium subrubescens]OKP09704.1 hypothetical protein PENSUB_4975 [Penicillium subrubescens]
MSFLVVPLVKFGLSKAKKHHAAKKQAKQAEQFQQPGYQSNYGTEPPIQMSNYPPNVGPGSNIQYPTGNPGESISKGTKVMGMFISGVRFLQFVFGLTVIGLYGRDVHHDHENGHTARAKWVFAMIAAFLATSTASVHMILPFMMRRVTYRPNPKLKLPQFVWEFILCILWLTLFGIFGKMYIGVYPSNSNDSSKRDTTTTTTDSSSSTSSSSSGLGDAAKIDRMRHAVWIDLVNLVMWVVTASWVLLRWLKSRRAADGAEMVDAEKAEQI